MRETISMESYIIIITIMMMMMIALRSFLIKTLLLISYPYTTATRASFKKKRLNPS